MGIERQRALHGLHELGDRDVLEAQRRSGRRSTATSSRSGVSSALTPRSTEFRPIAARWGDGPVLGRRVAAKCGCSARVASRYRASRIGRHGPAVRRKPGMGPPSAWLTASERISARSEDVVIVEGWGNRRAQIVTAVRTPNGFYKAPDGAPLVHPDTATTPGGPSGVAAAEGDDIGRFLAYSRCSESPRCGFRWCHAQGEPSYHMDARGESDRLGASEAAPRRAAAASLVGRCPLAA